MAPSAPAPDNSPKFSTVVPSAQKGRTFGEYVSDLVGMGVDSLRAPIRGLAYFFKGGAHYEARLAALNTDAARRIGATGKEVLNGFKKWGSEPGSDHPAARKVILGFGHGLAKLLGEESKDFLDALKGNDVVSAVLANTKGRSGPAVADFIRELPAGSRRLLLLSLQGARSLEDRVLEIRRQSLCVVSAIKEDVIANHLNDEFNPARKGQVVINGAGVGATPTPDKLVGLPRNVSQALQRWWVGQVQEQVKRTCEALATDVSAAKDANGIERAFGDNVSAFRKSIEELDTVLLKIGEIFRPFSVAAPEAGSVPAAPDKLEELNDTLSSQSIDPSVTEPVRAMWPDVIGAMGERVAGTFNGNPSLNDALVNLGNVDQAPFVLLGAGSEALKRATSHHAEISAVIREAMERSAPGSGAPQLPDPLPTALNDYRGVLENALQAAFSPVQPPDLRAVADSINSIVATDGTVNATELERLRSSLVTPAGSGASLNLAAGIAEAEKAANLMASLAGEQDDKNRMVAATFTQGLKTATP